MKCIYIAIAAIMAASVACADFATPLADFPVGTNATGKITLIATNTVDGTTNFTASIFTDSGPRTYPVLLPPEVTPSDFLGKECLIEAVIEKDDTAKWGRRFRITKIELKNRKSH